MTTLSTPTPDEAYRPSLVSAEELARRRSNHRRRKAALVRLRVEYDEAVSEAGSMPTARERDQWRCHAANIAHIIKDLEETLA